MHSRMSEPAELAATAVPPPADAAAEQLSRDLGIGLGPAHLLVGAGHWSVEQVRGLSVGDLRDLGLDPADIERIRALVEARSAAPPAPVAVVGDPPPPARVAVDGEKIVTRWLDSVRKSERPKRRQLT